MTIDMTPHAKDDPVLQNLPGSFRAFGGHKESCQNVPPRAKLLAGSEMCPVQMIRVKQNIYATQFHPELDKQGLALRIEIYKHAGYFPPEDAQKLIDVARDEVVTVPMTILTRFVDRYRQQ